MSQLVEISPDGRQTVEVVFNHIDVDVEGDYKDLVGRLGQDVYALRKALGVIDGPVTMSGILLPGSSGHTAEVASTDSTSATIRITNKDGEVTYVYNDGALSVVEVGELIAVPPDSDGIQTAMLVFNTMQAATIGSTLK